MSRIQTINMLKVMEEKKQDLEYLLKQANSYYCEEVNIDVSPITKDFNFDGARMITVNNTIFIGYLVAELDYCEVKIKELIKSLGGC